MIGSIKRLVLVVFHRTGILYLYHRVRNPRTLTVVLFHRVLDAVPDAQGNWPGYTVTPAIFESCLRFFRRHYNIVSMEQVTNAAARGEPLPARALLVSFDDGWRDTLEVAGPILARLSIPAVLFAIGRGGDREPWQEPLLRAWFSGAVRPAMYQKLRAAAGRPEAAAGDCRRDDSLHRLLVALEAMDPDRRERLIAEHCPGLPPPAAHCMLAPEELREWTSAGHALGAHGFTHHPLPFVPDPRAEMDQARASLEQAAGAGRVDTLSFPHGRYNPAVVAQAFEAGYRCLFTSDAVANIAGHGIPSPMLGRVEPGMANTASADGGFRPEILASRLFFLPRKRLPGKPAPPG